MHFSRRLLLALGLSAITGPFSPCLAIAQWTPDGVPVCTAIGGGGPPQLVSDGGGGAIVTWSDHRSGNNDIYAQHVMASGVIDPDWPMHGRAVCSAIGDQYNPQIVSDGAGGAIVAWHDTRNGNYDVYSQHVMASGVVDPDWPVDGRALCTRLANQTNPQIVSDGANGAVVAWDDDGNIYAQRVMASGVVDPAWPPDGRAVSGGGDFFQGDCRIISDGAGGAIVTWDGVGSGSWSIYAQRVMASGAVDPTWPPDGRALCTANRQQGFPQIVSDGAGGAIVTWQDWRTASYDIYAQRVLASGAVDPAWPPDGRALCTATSFQQYPQIISDAAGGAIVTWQDSRIYYSVYAQRVLNAGTVDSNWPLDGRELRAGGLPHIASDGAGGAIVVMLYGDSPETDIYAQRVMASGAVDAGWSPSGSAICRASGSQVAATTVSDGAGGAIVAWLDGRSGAVGVYAQRVDHFGMGYACPTRNEIDLFEPGAGTDATEASQSIGEPDRSGTPLGYEGHLVLRFPDGIPNGQGPDLLVYELGHNFPPAIDENYRVEASADGNTYVSLGEAPGDVASFDLAAGGLSLVHYIRITDLPPNESLSIPGYDSTVVGADIDAIVPLNCQHLVGVQQEVVRVLNVSSVQPNPMRDRASLHFELGARRFVRSAVYDVGGRMIQSIAAGEFDPGEHIVTWNTLKGDRDGVSPGVYFWRLSIGDRRFQRMIAVIP
jgi:hypothetical protein